MESGFGTSGATGDNENARIRRKLRRHRDSATKIRRERKELIAQTYSKRTRHKIELRRIVNTNEPKENPDEKKSGTTTETETSFRL